MTKQIELAAHKLFSLNIISQIREAIVSGIINPGDRLSPRFAKSCLLVPANQKR